MRIENLNGRTSAKCLIAVMACLLCVSAGCWPFDSQPDYAQQNEKLAKSLFHNLPDYTWLPTPGGDNAAGTIRLLPCDKPFAECFFLGSPDSNFFASGVSDTDRKDILSRLIETTPEGDLSLNQNIQTNIDLNTVAPNIENILSAQANIDLSHDCKVSLIASDMKQEEINVVVLQEALNDNKLDPTLSAKLKSGEYNIVTQDIRYGGFGLDVDTTGNDSLTTTLKTQAAASAVVGQGAGLSLAVTQISSTEFHLTDTKPVVAGYLVMPAVPDLGHANPASLKLKMTSSVKLSKKARNEWNSILAAKGMVAKQ